MRNDIMNDNRRNTTVKFNKKNDGQEINLNFTYLSRKELNTAEKVRIELWVRQQGTLMLHVFKQQFPEMMT
jgi:hypothetical protein